MGTKQTYLSWRESAYGTNTLLKYFVGKNITWTFANPTSFKPHNNDISNIVLFLNP